MRTIPLTRGAVALVDDEDYERLAAHKWHLSNRGYAARTPWLPGGKKRVVLMHREILGAPTGVVVDHVNADKLDNRRANLRQCSQRDNLRNRRKGKGTTSRFKGVFHLEKRGVWLAYITTDGGCQRLGRFRSEIAAALAYDDAARDHFGDFARLNFPVGGEQAA